MYCMYSIQYVRSELVCKLLRQDYTHFRGLRDLEIGQSSDQLILGGE